jgi:hypothetical protein
LPRSHTDGMHVTRAACMHEASHPFTPLVSSAACNAPCPVVSSMCTCDLHETITHCKEREGGAAQTVTRAYTVTVW